MTTSPRPERWVSLEERSGQFAAEIQAKLDGAERYLVTPDGLNPKARRIPLFVADEYLADLDVALYLSLDRTGQYLKTVRSDISIHSVLDRTPLLRYDYRSDMKADPVAHWQVYAERGAVSHLLTKASANAARTRRPHRPRTTCPACTSQSAASGSGRAWRTCSSFWYSTVASIAVMDGRPWLKTEGSDGADDSSGRSSGTYHPKRRGFFASWAGRWSRPRIRACLRTHALCARGESKSGESRRRPGGISDKDSDCWSSPSRKDG